MAIRVSLLAAVLLLPLGVSADPDVFPGTVVFRERVQSSGDSCDADPLAIMLGGITSRAEDDSSVLPFGLDRLFSLSNLTDAFEFPGRLRVDVGLDGVGLSIDF